MCFRHSACSLVTERGMRPHPLLTSVLLTCILPSIAMANSLSLAPQFTDHAVLQRDKPVPVWGEAQAGGEVVVTFAGQTCRASASASGRWQITLTPMSASAKAQPLTATCGAEKIVREDVVIGEVWLCSGQSNMEWPLNLARGGTEAGKQTFPWLRQLHIAKRPADAPAESVSCPAGWVVFSPDTFGDFTAVGFFFAQTLHARLGVPIGVVNASWGGTPQESWSSRETLQRSLAWLEFERTWSQALKEFDQKQREYPELDRLWRAADEESRRTGQPNPLPWPHPPVGPGTAYAPGALFNGMISPFAPYALRGVLWYQGESNIGHPREFADLFPALVGDWRRLWSEPALPFFYVQIPNYADHDPAGTAWAELREAQRSALTLPGTGMIVAIDLGEAGNIHPTDKRPVGDRLAKLAAARCYGLSEEWSGPVVRRVARDGSALVLEFDHATGLELRGDASGFSVAGADGKFATAAATLQGQKILLTAPAVTRPISVRYAWANQPAVSLYNAAGLPAAPFQLSLP